MLATPLQSSLALAVPVLPGAVEAEQSTCTLGGQLISGAWVSLTVIVCTQLEELPQLSVAVQVRAITWLPAQAPGASTSLWPMLATPLQSSVALAVPVLDGSLEALQSMLASAGQLIAGPVVSLSVSVCTQLEELPQSSAAVQVRVITWLPAQAPGASAST